ncbi:MAG TPA: hypothetical protein VGN42_06795 [Pirellulales bacterium]|jgi:hypothetical protein|nr:hypothetical protein [Pirellulales bacterium]
MTTTDGAVRRFRMNHFFFFRFSRVSRIFEWQSRDNFRMFLARRDGYGFLFSVRRAFINRSACHSHAARLGLGQLMCRGGEAMRTEKRNP